MTNIKNSIMIMSLKSSNLEIVVGSSNLGKQTDHISLHSQSCKKIEIHSNSNHNISNQKESPPSEQDRQLDDLVSHHASLSDGHNLSSDSVTLNILDENENENNDLSELDNDENPKESVNVSEISNQQAGLSKLTSVEFIKPDAVCSKIFEHESEGLQMKQENISGKVYKGGKTQLKHIFEVPVLEKKVFVYHLDSMCERGDHIVTMGYHCIAKVFLHIMNFLMVKEINQQLENVQILYEAEVGTDVKGEAKGEGSEAIEIKKEETVHGGESLKGMWVVLGDYCMLGDSCDIWGLEYGFAFEDVIYWKYMERYVVNMCAMFFNFLKM